MTLDLGHDKNARVLQRDEPLARELTLALKEGLTQRLAGLLQTDPGLARCYVQDPGGGGRSPLHLFADWPGHRPNAHAIVQLLAVAGADLDAEALGMWHRETPLHWAASNDDVVLIDALLHAGAHIEYPGSSIDGGSPLSCAVGYGQWQAARRLVERGARTLLWHEAALGLMAVMAQRFTVNPPPQPGDVSGAFWNACHGGQPAAAQYLLERGAELNWAAPWSDETPLDIAEKGGHSDVVAWLRGLGAVRAKDRA